MANPSSFTLSSLDIKPFAVVVATAVVVALAPGSPLSPLSPFGNTKLNFAALAVPAFVTLAVVPLVTVPTVIVAACPGSPLSPFDSFGFYPQQHPNGFEGKPEHHSVLLYNICHLSIPPLLFQTIHLVFLNLYKLGHFDKLRSFSGPTYS